MIFYDMVRGGEVCAHVAVFPNRKCVVSWPTSTVVYDSFAAAWAVHVEHMGGRGEPTKFVLVIAEAPYERGFMEAYQDDCEGVGLHAASGPGGAIVVPDYIPEGEREAWAIGYECWCIHGYGLEWRGLLVARTPQVQEENDGE